MSGPSLDLVLAALEDLGSRYRHQGEHVQAVCPAHQDREPSLSIDWKPSGKTLITCRAGCRTADVIAALGLSWGDLYDEPRDKDRWSPRPARRPAADPMDGLRRVLERAVAMINAKAAQRHWRRWTPAWPQLSAEARIELAEWGEKQDQDAWYWRTVARQHFEPAEKVTLLPARTDTRAVTQIRKAS